MTEKVYLVCCELRALICLFSEPRERVSFAAGGKAKRTENLRNSALLLIAPNSMTEKVNLVCRESRALILKNIKFAPTAKAVGA